VFTAVFVCVENHEILVGFSNIARTRLRQRSCNTCIKMLWNA